MGIIIYTETRVEPLNNWDQLVVPSAKACSRSALSVFSKQAKCRSFPHTQIQTQGPQGGVVGATEALPAQFQDYIKGSLPPMDPDSLHELLKSREPEEVLHWSLLGSIR